MIRILCISVALAGIGVFAACGNSASPSASQSSSNDNSSGSSSGSGSGVLECPQGMHVSDNKCVDGADELGSCPCDGSVAYCMGCNVPGQYLCSDNSMKNSKGTCNYSDYGKPIANLNNGSGSGSGNYWQPLVDAGNPGAPNNNCGSGSGDWQPLVGDCSSPPSSSGSGSSGSGSVQQYENCNCLIGDTDCLNNCLGSGKGGH